ncbi:ABC transporter permease subunit [Micromonospora avicenniae]|uniref:ABC-2 family transporter protein n=1 Tax=Micromonospora avicenniae TaxID=1198245 RepID=A0A1N6Y2Z2_9ACTN|nr:ABC transporter permease subunit [Micromonospora avicenniae]SIR09045.1 ABC-2 family transporter protein [Micromonospora avicenniae]
MNLVRAELERLGARRFVQLMLVLLVLAFGVTASTTLAGSHQPTAAELTDARTQAAESRRQMDEVYQRCVAQVNGNLPPGSEQEDFPADCSEFDPVLQDRLPVATDFLPGVFVFSQQAEPLLYFLIAFLALFGFLVGASYVGADLNSGGVVNLLLWRPRRMTVLGTKLGTLMGAVLGLSLLASLVYLATFWVIGQSAGLPGQLDGAFWAGLGAVHARGLVLVLLTSVLGFALATLGRHTSAALGTVAAYAVVWELGARLVMEIVDTAHPDRFMLSSHVGAWLSGRLEFWDASACASASGFCERVYALTWQPALAVLLGLTALLAVAAFSVFRRRDLI